MVVISRCNLRDGTSGFAGLQKWQGWGVNGRLAASAALSASRGGLSRRVGAVGYVRRNTRVRRQRGRMGVGSPGAHVGGRFVRTVDRRQPACAALAT